MRIRRRLIGLLLAMGLCATVHAQTTQPRTQLLGPKFSSPSAGIALSPPAGMATIRGSVGSSEVVRFMDEKQKWVLKVSRVLLEPDKPLPLTTWRSKEGKDLPGMLQLTAEQFLSDFPGTQELRRDTSTLSSGRPMGLHAAKFSFGIETNMTQQAIIPANIKEDKAVQYYILALTCPAPREGDLEKDPGILKAAETFEEVLNSVEILDQKDLQDDRDKRLGRTQLLYVNLKDQKLRDSLQAGQWLRVIRDGKDVGFKYVIEEIAQDLPRKTSVPPKTPLPFGVLIGERSRMVATDGGRVDSESWQFCTFDRNYESFSTTVYTESPRMGKIITGDIGMSRSRPRPVAVGPAEGLAGGRGEMVMGVQYKLEVNRIGRNTTSEPLVRELPPYYLPLAIEHLLPRILDTRKPDTYLFASWVPEAGQVMYRYIDVDKETEVELNGRRVTAIPIQDRIGLEGTVTTHYVSIDRTYLGSKTPETRTIVVPSDESTLRRLWQDADLTRPGAVEGARR